MPEAPGSPSEGFVIGIDIGTTSTKSVAYDVEGHAGAAHAVDYPLTEPAPDTRSRTRSRSSRPCSRPCAMWPLNAPGG